MLKNGEIDDILKQLNIIDNVICFGAGKRVELLKDIFAETDILKKIKYFIDNDSRKYNKKICINGKLIDIISFCDFKRKKINNCIILVTPIKYQEILKQLSEDINTKNITCFCISHLIALLKEKSAMNKKIPSSLKINTKELIPKVIHYCWFGKNPLPDKHKKWMESWYKFCPDYKIIEWNENNYDITKNNYMNQAYEEKKWGFVPDFARLDIIYNFGGVYLDTDVELINNIDDLLYQKGFAGFESDEYVALGLGFGAVKGLPIIKEMLNLYKKINFVDNNGKLNTIASPVWQTKILKQKGLITNGEYQIVKDLTILPEKVLSGKSASTRRIKLTSYTKAIHHYEGSWLNEDKKKEFFDFEEEMNGRR